MINEKMNGGLCNNRIEKSVTNKLVSNGCSRNAERIFLKIGIESVMSVEFGDVKNSAASVKSTLANSFSVFSRRFYYIPKSRVKENPSSVWV
jgi:hypothetical protein